MYITPKVPTSESGPDFAEEEEDDQYDEQHADEKGALNVADAGANGDGAVDFNGDANGGWDLRLQMRQLREHVVDCFYDVGAGRLEDDDQDGRFHLRAGAIVGSGETGGVDVRYSIFDCAQVCNSYGCASGLVIAGDDGFVVAGFEYLIVVVDEPAMLAVLKTAFRAIGIGAGERGAYGFEADAVGAELHGIEFNAHGWAGAAADEDLAYAFDLRDLLRQDRIGYVVHLGLGFDI